MAKKHAPEVDVELAPCPACGSTKRGPYVGNRLVQEYAGVHDGKPYTRIVRRRCHCADCGQMRIERSFENGAIDADGC